jgi:hypothetical protein
MRRGIEPVGVGGSLLFLRARDEDSGEGGRKVERVRREEGGRRTGGVHGMAWLKGQRLKSRAREGEEVSRRGVGLLIRGLRAVCGKMEAGHHAQCRRLLVGWRWRCVNSFERTWCSVGSGIIHSGVCVSPSTPVVV